MHLRSSGNNVAQQRLGALHVDGEIVVDEKYRHLPFFFASARLQKQQFVDHALVGAKANGVPEESSYRAKLATVGTTSSGLDGDNAERSPAFSNLLQHCLRDLGHKIELLEIDRLPWNHRILFQRRLALFARLVYRFVDFLEFA